METLRKIWKSRNSRKAYIAHLNRTVKVDGFMTNIITALGLTHYKTLACCSGRGKYPVTIFVKDVLGIFDLISGRAISRKKRFYFKDDRRFYYLPETICIINKKSQAEDDRTLQAYQDAIIDIAGVK